MPAVLKIAEAPRLTVSAQQTRFESSALTAPTVKDILIKDLCITIEPNKEILSHADLHLKANGHYVLVGRNGTGKSTLLRALANGLIPGISWQLRILLLGQTRETELDAQLADLSLTESENVLQHVLRSDEIRERRLGEAERLNRAFDDSSKDPTALVRVLRQIQHERMSLELDENKRLAERRSGARGKLARKEQIEAEARHVLTKLRAKEDLSAIDASTLSRETQDASDLLVDIQSQLALLDADAAESNARRVLLGLGFKLDQIEGPMTNLSGGWRTRCDLACALCQKTDVLLLDEPTNFLDLPSIIWLQRFINDLADTTVLVVTHDRDFADSVGDDLIILRAERLEPFKGTISVYESEKWKKIKWLTAMKENQEKNKSHMEQSIRDNLQAAKKHGDDKKLRQVASRRKKIDERMGMEVSAKGGRFKVNRDFGVYSTNKRAAIEIPDFEKPVKLTFPILPADLRFPGALVSLENVSYRYSSKTSSPEVLTEINLTIHPGERVGIVGLNGSGKTTLISLITGSDEDERLVRPSRGNIARHARCRIARFSQHTVEQLQLHAASNPTATALSHLLEVAGGSENMSEKEARSVLGDLGLQGQLASDIPIAALSGGQKVRLAFAKLVYKPPQLLVLDEVTTHLDSDTIQSLIRALKRYEGALLVVTHDRFFMRCVVEGESPTATAAEGGEDYSEDENQDNYQSDDDRAPGSVYRLTKGRLKKLERGMDEYEEIATRAAGKLTAGKLSN